MLLSITYEARRVRTEIEQSPYRLGAASPHDQGEPLRKDVVVAGEHRDREEPAGREARGPGDKAEQPSAETGEGGRLHHDVLIEDSPPQRLPRHHEYVLGHSEHGHDGESSEQPRQPCPRARRQRVEDHQRDRDRAQAAGDEQPVALARQIALLLLEAPGLARVPDRLADVLERFQEVLRTGDAAVVLDEGLFVRKAHGDPVDAGTPAERLFDRPRAERAVKPADLRPDARPALGGRGLLVPIRGRASRRRLAQPATSKPISVIRVLIVCSSTSASS